MPLAARRLFQTSPFGTSPRAHVRAPRPERDTQGQAEVPAEGGIGGRLRPQAVIEMGRHHRKSPMATQTGKDVEQRHRIGAAGEADDHAFARGRMPDPSQGLGNSGLERGAPHREGFLLRGVKWWRCRDLNPGRRGYEPRALTN